MVGGPHSRANYIPKSIWVTQIVPDGRKQQQQQKKKKKKRKEKKKKTFREVRTERVVMKGIGGGEYDQNT
jgi:hypothetical protein